MYKENVERRYNTLAIIRRCTKRTLYSHFWSSLSKLIYDYYCRNKRLMHILIFDTETSGLPSSDGRDWSTARLIQISWIVVTENGNVQKEGNYLIKDQTYVSNEEALSCHHITEADRNKFGVPAEEALSEFIFDCSKVNLIVCHSGIFDFGVLNNECAIRKISLRPMLDIGTYNTKKSNVYIGMSPTTLSDCIATADPDYNPPGGLQPHDALFDTYLCWRLFQLTKNYKVMYTVREMLKYIGQIISGRKQVRVT